MCKKKLFRHYATASFCNARGGENSAIRAVLKKQPLIRKKAPFERCFFC